MLCNSLYMTHISLVSLEMNGQQMVYTQLIIHLKRATSLSFVHLCHYQSIYTIFCMHA